MDMARRRSDRKYLGSEECTSFYLTKGDRVAFSEVAVARHPRYAHRIGIVVSERIDSSSVRVLWEGLRTPVSISKSYLRKLDRG